LALAAAASLFWGARSVDPATVVAVLTGLPAALLEGGWAQVSAGLGIVDTMKFVQCDVSTYIIGQAASMGSVIASCGTKGKRFCLPNARNLMHQPLIGGVLEGQATDLEIEAREMLRIRDRLYAIYADNTGQNTDKIKADCDRNKWLDEQEMLDYGLIDKVLRHMPKMRKDGAPKDDE
ncbi:MAG: ATP-dependent Clp protease proteolytic subunit, partial [Phycisphaerales bacterium]